MKVENLGNLDKEQDEMTATEAVLLLVRELADKCNTLDEFREALARIIAKK